MVAKAGTKKQDGTIGKFRVAITCTQRANIPLEGLDRPALTVRVMSGPHSQIGALL